MINPWKDFFKEKNGNNNPSGDLLQVSDTNIILNERLGRIGVVLHLAHSSLANPHEVGQSGEGKPLISDDWDWLKEFADDCYIANHNIDGVPRVQFIEGLKASANEMIRQEIEKHRLLNSDT